MKITKRKIDNSEEIVALAKSYASQFMDYPENGTHRLFNPYRDTYDPQDDRFHTLRMGYNMPGDLADLITTSLKLSEQDLKHDICLHRYDPGDYRQPRHDEGRKGIVTLTTSEVDGLTVATESGRFKKVPDEAGAYIVTDRKAWHWVDPVREGPRFVIVSNPPFRGRIPVKRQTSGPSAAKREDQGPAPRPRTTGVYARGATAIVYETEDPDYILKSCWRTAPYDSFLKILKVESSPHLPRIRHLACNPDGRQWIEMERLWPLGKNDPLWPVVNAFAEYCHAVADRRPIEPSELLTDELARVAHLIGASARRYRVSLDLSFANIMVRPNTDEIVIIDPFF